MWQRSSAAKACASCTGCHGPFMKIWWQFHRCSIAKQLVPIVESVSTWWQAIKTTPSIGEIKNMVAICVQLALSYMQPKSLCLLVPRDHHFCQKINCSIHLAMGQPWLWEGVCQLRQRLVEKGWKIDIFFPKFLHLRMAVPAVRNS